jgi:hypothetical protein|tara:strand:+ start:812 stop:1540 length:729 start_codon:yes stop_codon:yes gene_type:complete
MAKIDKTQYTKQEFRLLKEQRRLAKLKKQSPIVPDQALTTPVIESSNGNTAFVLGNGTSRESLEPSKLQAMGKVYGCNALYRTFAPDYLIAVDVKMILEINKNGYHRKHQVWTNPNKAYTKMQDFNFFQPSKGWSSGPTALWLSVQHGYKHIYILGFDYQGLGKSNKFNNIYADSMNYKKSSDSATFYGNWMRQTKSVVQDNPKIQFTRVIAPDNYIPEELNKFSNLEHITIDVFKKIHNFS